MIACPMALLIADFERINEARCRVGTDDQAINEHERVIEVGVGVAVGRRKFDGSPSLYSLVKPRCIKLIR